MSAELRDSLNMDDLVEVRGIRKTFSTPQGELVACTDIDFTIRKGRSFGLVGESGSGKSTVMRIVQLLLPPSAGEVWMNGVNVSHMSQRRLKPYRRNVQFVAQDPYGSLFPHFTVGKNIMEPLRIHAVGSKQEQMARAVDLMDAVGLRTELFHKFPHELSGGQQQRVAIARALALSPQLLVLDEAVSSLDVSIQAQILNLLQGMKDDLGLTYAFISHNLAVIRQICEETAVMYLGRIVEIGPSDELFHHPLHPYTRSLLDAIPAFVGDRVKPLPTTLQHVGSGPLLGEQTVGCPYHPRCPLATDICRTEAPGWSEPVPGRRVTCHHAL